MAYKNPQELVVGLAQLPVAIEAKLPEGAPKLSQMMIDASTKGPVLPNFPMEIPDLPAVPEMPGLPAPPGAAGLKTYVSAVEVRPTPTPTKSTVTPLVQAYTPPLDGVVGQVTTRRGM